MSCRLLQAAAGVLALLWAATADAQCGYDAVGVGNNYSCAVSVTDDQLDCWGLDSGPTISSVPATTATKMAAGYTAGCLIKLSDSTLECWDVGGSGMATGVPSGAHSYVEAGSSSACAMSTGGTLSCWGNLVVSFDVAVPGSTAESLGGGEDTYCAVLSTGALECFGVDYFENVMTEPAGTDYALVDTSGFHACAVKDDQSIACWGADYDGEATPPAGTFTDVATGPSSTCAVGTDASITCWGNTSFTSGAVPTNCDWVSIESDGGNNYCAIDTAGNVDCWGYDSQTNSEDHAADCAITPTTCGATTTTLPSRACVIFFGE